MSFGGQILMNHFKKISSKNFQLDLEQDYLLAISVIVHAFSEDKLSSFFIYGKVYYHPENWLHHHQTNILLLKGENYPEFQSTHVNYLVVFYSISTLVGYLMPNPFYTYILNIHVLLVGCVLWYTNPFCLCNIKSCLYQIYMIYKWIVCR